MNKFLLRIFALLILILPGQFMAQTSDDDFDFLVVSPASAAGSYEWGGTTDFGPSIDDNFCGELIWGGEVENLACEPITTDLDGKIALIRRGTCDFSLKIWHAQEAGASAVVVVGHDQDENGLGAIVGMLGGDMADSVTIPAIFISYLSGEIIVPALAAGPVEVCFERPTFNEAYGPYSYSTPQSQIIPLENIYVSVTNRGLEEKRDVTCTVEITNPIGDVEVLTETRDLPVGDSVRYIFDSYLPKELGEYNMKFISGNDDKVIEKKFEITEYTFAVDNGTPINAVGPSAQGFVDANFFYQHANLVLAGGEAVATHITFGLGNGEELLSGDESSDVVIYAIYNGDADGDGTLDNFNLFEDLGDPIALGVYQIQGDETFDNLITIPLESPFMIEENGIYYVSMAYDGAGAGTGVPPEFSASTKEDYFALITPLQLDQLYSGWENFTPITRLHLEGFVSSTEDLAILESDKLKILSNPVENHLLRFDLQLEESSKKVNVFFRDLNGRLIKQLDYSNVNSLRESINTKELSAGTYFLNVLTDEGFRSEKVIIAE